MVRFLDMKIIFHERIDACHGFPSVMNKPLFNYLSE